MVRGIYSHATWTTLVEAFYRNLGNVQAEFFDDRSSFGDRTFALALLKTVSENEDELDSYMIFKLCRMRIDPRRLHRVSADHRLNRLRFVRPSHKRQRRRFWTTIEKEWERGSARVSEMATHFKRAVAVCGRKLTAEVLAMFGRTHGRKGINKRDLAHLAAMHVAGATASAAEKGQEEGEEEEEEEEEDNDDDDDDVTVMDKDG